MQGLVGYCNEKHSHYNECFDILKPYLMQTFRSHALHRRPAARGLSLRVTPAGSLSVKTGLMGIGIELVQTHHVQD